MAKHNDVLTVMTKQAHLATDEFLLALREAWPGTRATVWIRIPTMTVASRYLIEKGLERTASFWRGSECTTSSRTMSEGPAYGFASRTPTLRQLDASA